MLESEKNKEISIKHICPDSCKSYNGKVGEITCKYHRELGKTYSIKQLGPNGICLDLYHSAYPYCLALSEGANFSWTQDKDVVFAQCPAPTKCVYFEVKRTILDEPIENNGIKKNKKITIKIKEIEDSEEDYNNGCINCPHNVGQEFEFNQGDFLEELCPAAFNNLWPTLKTIINDGKPSWEKDGKIYTRCPDNDTRIAFEILNKNTKNEMIYKTLNKIGKVSQIGFGCWQLGGGISIGDNPLGYGKFNEKEARKAIHYAIENGVNFFDTADIYGIGKSETILGEEIKGKRDSLIICTKVGYVPDGIKGNTLDFSYDNIIASCNRSLKRLQTNYIDVYLLHNIPPENKIKDSLKALNKLKKAGKIREYGISIGHQLNRIPELVDDFPIIECYYNMLLKDFEKYEELIKEKNTGIIVASPLSRGLLSGKDYDLIDFEKDDVRSKWKLGESQNQWYEEQKQKVTKLNELSKESNISLKNLAIAFILSNNVSTIIPGMKTCNQVSELLDSLNHLPLSSEIINKIKKE